MDQNRKKLLENFSTRRILIPVAIGLGAVGYMLYRDPAARDLGALADAKLHWLLITPHHRKSIKLAPERRGDHALGVCLLRDALGRWRLHRSHFHH